MREKSQDNEAGGPQDSSLQRGKHAPHRRGLNITLAQGSGGKKFRGLITSKPPPHTWPVNQNLSFCT